MATRAKQDTNIINFYGSIVLCTVGKIICINKLVEINKSSQKVKE